MLFRSEVGKVIEHGGNQLWWNQLLSVVWRLIAAHCPQERQCFGDLDVSVHTVQRIKMRVIGDQEISLTCDSARKNLIVVGVG